MCDRFLGVGPFWPPHPWAALKMPILNRVKQHSSNTWGLIHKKVKDTEAVEKKALLIKNKKCQKRRKSEMFLNQKLPRAKRPSY